MEWGERDVRIVLWGFRFLTHVCINGIVVGTEMNVFVTLVAHYRSRAV